MSEKEKKIVITEDNSTGNWVPNFGECTVENAFMALQVALIRMAEVGNISMGDLMVMLDASFTNCAQHMPEDSVFGDYEEKKYSSNDLIRAYLDENLGMHIRLSSKDYDQMLFTASGILDCIAKAYGKSKEEVFRDLSKDKYKIKNVRKIDDGNTVLS